MERNRSLEGVRGLAALLVFGVHAGSVSGFTLRHDAGAFLARMDVGVSIFFVLSGYLLYRPHVVAALDGTAPPRVLTYLRRRVLRIVPAYWVALALIPLVLGTVAIDTWTDIIIYGGFAQIYDGRTVFGGIVQAWSLCTEMSFYLALPVVAAVVRRLGGRRVSAHVTLVVVAYGSSVLWRWWLRVADPPMADVGSLWLPGTADLFALGILIALVDVGRHRSSRLAAVAARVQRLAPLAWPAAVGVFVAVAVVLELPRNFEPTTTAQDLVLQAAYGLIGLLVVTGATFGPSDGIVRRTLASSVAAWLGTVSYGFYVWHLDVLERTAEFLEVRDGGVSIVVLGAIALPVTIGAAGASWYLVERPVQRWRRPRRPAPSSPTVSAAATG